MTSRRLPVVAAVLLVYLPGMAGAVDPVGQKYAAWEAAAPEPIPGKWRFLGPRSYVAGVTPGALIGGLGRVLDVATHPEDATTLFVATAGSGVWKTAGGSWVPITNDLKPVPAVTSLAIDPATPGTMYALTGRGHPGNVESVPSSGVLKTTDGGESWTYLPLPWPRQKIHYAEKVVINPACKALFVVAWANQSPYGGVFRSQNHGETWDRIPITGFQGSFRDLEVHPSDPSVMYVSTDQDVIRLEQCGDAWRNLSKDSKGLPAPKYTGRERVALAVSPASPDTVYALYAGTQGFAGIYRSDDRGDTFTLRSNLPNILALDKFGLGTKSIAWFALGFAASPCNAEEIHVGSYNAWRSMDGGKTWSRTSYWQEKDAATVPDRYLHIDIQNLVFTEPVGGCGADGSATQTPTLYALSDGGISRSVDGAEKWVDLSTGLAITQVYRLCGSGADLDLLYAGCQDIGTNRLVRGVAVHTYAGDGTYCMIHPEDPKTIYVSYQYGRLFKSEDGARSFVERTPPSPDRLTTGGRLAILWPFVLQPGAPDTIYGCYPDHLWRSGDGGVNWSELAAMPQPKQRCVGLAVSEKAREIFAAKPKHVYRYLPGRQIWQDVTPPQLQPEATIVSVDIFDVAKLFNQFFGVLYDSDEPDDSDEPAEPADLGTTAAFVLYELNRGALGSSPTFGILQSANNGATWEKNDFKGLPDIPGNTLHMVPEFRGQVSLAGLYLGMDIGVYRSEVGFEEPWRPLGEVGGGEGQLPAVPVMAIDFQTDGKERSRLRVGTLGQGIWEFIPELEGQEPR